jgi:hypothetical protein
MIHVIFTLDYEIYGNGTGSLLDLVYEPTARLMEAFVRLDARFVNYVEAAEFEMIEARRTDPAIDLVTRQVREGHDAGFEVALHLHPQWCGARYELGQWVLDYGEYNLCTLPTERIEHIVDRALAFLRRTVGRDTFTPLAFRAGNWLFQPTAAAARVLRSRGLRIDSSVFKGGVQHVTGLDYRRALGNDPYWTFESDATQVDPQGGWFELPIYAEMVPFWRMVTSKRVGLQTRGAAAGRDLGHRIARIRDYARLRYPLKLDFCRMTLDELTAMMRLIIRRHRSSAGAVPIVAIGHSKDLTDLGTIEAFLQFLRGEGIQISTFADVFPLLRPTAGSSLAGGSKLEAPLLRPRG